MSFRHDIEIWRSPMEIQAFGVQLGRNRWSDQAVFELRIDLQELEGRSLGTLPGYQKQILDFLPEPNAYLPAHADVVRRLEILKNLSEAAIMLPEHLTRVILGLAGCGSSLGRLLPEPTGGYRLILGFTDEWFDRQVVQDVFQRIQRLLEGLDPHIEEWLPPLLERANRSRLGPSTLSITEALQAQDVPVVRLNTGSLIQFGWGSRQRRIWTAQTDKTGGIATDIASDKDLTRRLLKASGIPVSEGRVVTDVEDAWSTACEVGFPVVVKPRDGNHADGVSIGLTTQAQVSKAYGIAAHHRPNQLSEVIVERFIPGVEHRVLIVDGKLVAAYKGEPARVIGDGIHTVQELVNRVNTDPRRGSGWLFPLDTVKIDDVARLMLEDQGHSADSIPAVGESVELTRSADTTTDVTDHVHPEVIARTVEAARVVGLDIAGIDLVTPDISKPMEEQGGAIVEVNAGPGLMSHLNPTLGTPRPVGKAIANILFEPGDCGRIPLIAVYQAQGAISTARKISKALDTPELSTGLICADGIFLKSRHLHAHTRPMSGSLQEMLTSPLVDAVVVEANPEEILNHGLGFDEAAIVVLINSPTSEASGGFFHKEAARLLVESVSTSGGTLIALTDEATARTWQSHSKCNVVWVDPVTRNTQHFPAQPGESPAPSTALMVSKILEQIR